MDKVSIIVPIYNVELYLNRCINALIKQTYKNLEIILVDDGSTDTSGDICDSFAEKDSRVIVIHQENQGVSAARNIALQAMTGQWVCFCDGDDWYLPNFVEKMLNCAQLEGADYIICDYQIVSEKRPAVISNSISNLSNGCSSRLVVACGPIASPAHMIRRELFEASGVRYPMNVKQYEELPVIPVLAKFATRIAIVNEPLYCYFQRGNGMSASNESINGEANFHNALNEMKKALGQGYDVELEYHAVYALLYGEILNLCKRRAGTSVIKKRINEYETQYPDYLRNHYVSLMPFVKRVFLCLVHKRAILSLRFFSWMHKKIVN